MDCIFCDRGVCAEQHAMPCHAGPVPPTLASLLAATLDMSAGVLAASGAARSEPMGYAAMWDTT